MENELYHFGVKGMKWGVRRYQKFDGTYTKAGLKRYHESESKYEKAKENYKSVKKSDASKYDKSYAKGKMKQAERQLKKDYKHLKYDKMGDLGKVRYMKGERVRENNKIGKYAKKGSAIVAVGSLYLNKKGVLTSKTTAKLLGGSATVMGAAYIHDFVKKKPNEQLRAYYSHTSNY